MSPLPVEDPTVKQFNQDIYDVFIARIKTLDSFSEPYRTKLKNGWRFGGQKSYSEQGSLIAKMTKDTIDLM